MAIIGGLVLVVIGGWLLLANYGVLRPIDWPLAGAIALLVIGGALVVDALLRGRGGEATVVSLQREGATALDAAIKFGGGTLRLTAGSVDLLDVRSGRDDVRAERDRHEGVTRIDLRMDDPSAILLRGPTDWLVTIAPDILLRLDVEGGASRVVLDLSGLRVARARVNAGAAAIQLVLPRPTADVPIRLEGGASSIDIVAPAGVEYRVTTSGGLVRVDGLTESPGYAATRERVTVEFTGGAAGLTIR